MATRSALVRLLFAAMLGLTWWLGHRPADGLRGLPEGEAPFRLRDVSEEVGVRFRHVAWRPDIKLSHIEPQIAGTGAAVSLVDFDGDGWLDIYATSSGGGTPNALFRNLGDGWREQAPPEERAAPGRFRDVAAEVGLADLNVEEVAASMGSVWADADDDGDKDVFVYAYGRQRLFRNDGGQRFVDVTAGSGLERRMNSNAATWLDYDRDGRLDLYVAGYFRDDTDLWALESTRVMHDSFEFADDGGGNYLYRNLGGLRFEDVTAATGVGSTRWTYAAASADFDDDGWPDLYLANDYGSEELFLNRQGQRFERIRGAGLEADSKSGMCVALGDVENEGRLAVFVTNISERGFLFQGNNLRLNYLGEAGQLLEVARGQVADCGWAWGAQFVDLDNDGWQDLFVSNGFVSADPDTSYWYDMGKIAGALGDLFEDAALWPPMEGRSLSGYERSSVLHNLRGKGFRDVAEAVGVDDRLDGRAVAVGDLFNDGAPDVVVANQRGALLVYGNEPLPGRNWAAIELVGASGNRDALGATVKAFVGPRVQRHTVLSASGFCAQNDHRLHVGLDDAERIDKLEIRWPSGSVQVIEELAAGQLHRILEPTP